MKLAALFLVCAPTLALAANLGTVVPGQVNQRYVVGSKVVFKTAATTRVTTMRNGQTPYVTAAPSHTTLATRDGQVKHTIQLQDKAHPVEISLVAADQGIWSILKLGPLNAAPRVP